MKGTHRIIVQNKRIRYDFEIKRNITVIRGNSATGKTALGMKFMVSVTPGSMGL